MNQAETPSVKRSRLIEKSPVYYGWLILLAGSFGLMMTMPGQTLSIAVFLDRIIEDLNFSRTTVSLMYTLATLLGSFSLPFVGRFIDAKGPRLAVIIISILFALSCVLMGFVQGLTMLFVGFVLIRALGQGALSMTSQHVINIWFVRRRGLAIGLSGLGFSIGVILFPLLINYLISVYDWRIAYMLLGLLVAVTILPVGALLYRNHPETYGLKPDGAGQQQTELQETHLTLSEARRTITFWLFTIAGFSVATLGTALIFHNYDILAAQGLERNIATLVFVPLGLVQFLATLLTGFFLDRVRPRFVLAAAQLLLACTLVLATSVNSLPLVYVYGICLGIMQGMSGAISAVSFAYYFGRRHLGSIKGVVTTIMVMGTALGPLLFSVGKDLFGSYGSIMLLTAVIPLSIAFIAPFIKPPVRQRA